MIIREARDEDWTGIYPFFAAIIAAGATYAYPDHLSLAEARPWWMEKLPGRTVVALVGAPCDAPSRSSKDHWQPRCVATPWISCSDAAPAVWRSRACRSRPHANIESDSVRAGSGACSSCATPLAVKKYRLSHLVLLPFRVLHFAVESAHAAYFRR